MSCSCGLCILHKSHVFKQNNEWDLTLNFGRKWSAFMSLSCWFYNLNPNRKSTFICLFAQYKTLYICCSFVQSIVGLGENFVFSSLIQWLSRKSESVQLYWFYFSGTQAFNIYFRYSIRIFEKNYYSPV